MTEVDHYTIGGLHFQILESISDVAQHVTTTINAPAGTVIVGGGARIDRDDPNSPGNWLTAMYPNPTGTTWTVASKDHVQASPARIVAFAVVVRLENGAPIPSEDYVIVSKTSKRVPHPSAQAKLPDGFTLVGGGVRDRYNGAGNMLYASYPTSDLSTWVGSGKDHVEQDPSAVNVWAIGLKTSFLRGHGLEVKVFEKNSDITDRPEIGYAIPNFHLTSVGARVNWQNEGNLLTACYPVDRQTVSAAARDCIVLDPSTLTVFIIGFKGL